MREAIEAAASAEVNERKVWEAAKAMGDQNSTFTSQRILQLRAKVGRIICCFDSPPIVLQPGSLCSN